jgi:hypothetical protein
LRATLAQLDAVIRLFEPTGDTELIPAIRPSRRNLFFRHGVQMRLRLEALREKGEPMQARSVAEYAMMMKGLPVDDARVRTTIIEQTRVAVARLEKRGLTTRRLPFLFFARPRGTFAATFLLATLAALEMEGVKLEDL